MSSNNKKEKEISPVIVTIIAVIISLVVVAIMFFVQTGILQTGVLERFMPKKHESINILLDRGKINEALDAISNQSDIVQGSDTSLFMQGKTWYLSAWLRYDNENWKDYAKNPADWFTGSDVDKALHLLKRSAESPATYAEATTLIGVIYMEKGWFDKAKFAFASVLKKDMSQRDAYLYYGVALSRTGQDAAAIKHLENWQNYQNDFDFLKNLFYLYLFGEKNYQKAAILGDMFLKTAPRGNPDIPKIKRELHDLTARFPEYFNDTMTIIKDRPPEFGQQRKR
jgi:tetratricopeptide (TPR) repeat protein